MMIGDPRVFAVESEIAQVAEELSQMALGFFGGGEMVSDTFSLLLWARP